MERGQDGPRETVVDAKRVGRSSGRLESAAILGLRVALARARGLRKAHLLSQSGGQRGGGRLDGEISASGPGAGNSRAMLARGPLRRQLPRMGLMPAI